MNPPHSKQHFNTPHCSFLFLSLSLPLFLPLSLPLFLSFSLTRRRPKCGICFGVLLWWQRVPFDCRFYRLEAQYRRNRSKLYLASIKYSGKHCKSEPTDHNIIDAPFLVSMLCMWKTHGQYVLYINT